MPGEAIENERAAPASHTGGTGASGRMRDPVPYKLRPDNAALSAADGAIPGKNLPFDS